MGEPVQSRQEQSAFANYAVGALLTALGSVFFAALSFIFAPLWSAAPEWARYALALSALASLIWFAVLFVLLGGAAEGSEHRAWFLRFRHRLADDNISGRYARGVSRTIAWTDRALGDGEGTRTGIYPRAFGLSRPAPLWTAKSYDRCLLLALTYPLFVMVLIWVVSGERGQMEVALGLRAVSEWWLRVLILLCMLGGLALIARGYMQGARVKHLLHFIPGLLLIGFVSPKLGGSLTIGILILGITYSLADKHDKLSGITAVSFAIAAVLTGLLSGYGTWWIYPAIAMLLLVVYLEDTFAPKLKPGFHSVTLAGATALLLVVSLWVSPMVAVGSTLAFNISMIYFLGLLTLVNAPFDWLAIGITRGLLRRGLEIGGLWPVAIALLDFVLSLIVLAALAVAVLWATEAFDLALIRNGFRPLIKVGEYLDAFADPAERVKPHYYWLYAMLFSSQIPAIVNFAFGALCLVRGIPALNAWLLARTSDAAGAPTTEIGSWRRLTIASVCAGQVFAATALGLIGYYALATVLIGLIDPIFGQGLAQLLRHARLAPGEF